MLTLPDRINVVFTALTTSARQFSMDHNLPLALLTQLLNEDGPTADVQLLEQLIVAEPRISAEYLLRGRGEPLLESIPVQATTELSVEWAANWLGVLPATVSVRQAVMPAREKNEFARLELS
jgi:negative regulator of sigma E activity